VIGGVRSQIIEIQANQDQRNVGFDVTGGWTVELYGGRNNLEVSYDVVISFENGRYIWRPVASTFRAYGYHLEPSEYLTPEVLQGCWHRNGSVIIHFNGDSHACDFNPVGTYFEHYHPGADGKMVFRRSAVSVPSAPTQTYTSGGQGGQTYSGVANSTATAEEILEYKRQLAQEYGLQMDEHGNYSGGWGRSGYGGVFGGTDTTGAMGLD
jgi:hypothetical protein